MLVTRKSRATGKIRTLDIPVTQEQLDKWQNGVLIQDAMPNISTDDREFIISGITKEEWDEIFGEDYE